MAGYGYGGFGGVPGGFGGFGAANIQQGYEQERIGYGPQGFGMYEQETQINRNPYTGATSIVRENEFIPMGGGGFPMGGGGFPMGGGGYGYGQPFF